MSISILSHYPKKFPVDVILDTDTYNEVDDQYALSYLLKNGEKLHTVGVYAAPFFDRERRFCNYASDSAAEGMEKSYDEILHLLSLMNQSHLSDRVFRGSDSFLKSETEPVVSPAAKDLAERAMNYTPDEPLYVVAIAAITNIASALLINPAIADRIVLVWLGGNAQDWPDCLEFNLFQDVAASRIISSSGMRLVQLPCMGVVSAFNVTPFELKAFLKGKNALCDYLCDYTIHDSEKNTKEPLWSRPIWDVTAVAWLLGGFCLSRQAPAQLPEYDGSYTFPEGLRPIEYVYYIQRDALLRDLFSKLSE